MLQVCHVYRHFDDCGWIVQPGWLICGKPGGLQLITEISWRAASAERQARGAHITILLYIYIYIIIIIIILQYYTYLYIILLYILYYDTLYIIKVEFQHNWLRICFVTLFSPDFRRWNTD